MGFRAFAEVRGWVGAVGGVRANSLGFKWSSYSRLTTSLVFLAFLDDRLEGPGGYSPADWEEVSP